jgi:GNAT superfamily N-acetyltransferase
VRVADPDPAAAMAALLRQCRERVLPQVGRDADTQVDLTWPSRDAGMTLVLLDHGLVPASVIAARPASRATPGTPSDVEVRQLAPEDLDAAAGLWLEEVRWDGQFGVARERPSTLPAIRRELDDVLAETRSWAWVATEAGQVCGLLVVQPPPRSGWIARLTWRDPVAYLTCLVVAPGRRGGGLGAALVRQAHDALDRAGIDLTLLHYAALNPLSAPFWHRCGYRPLWTVWHAHPAHRLGVTR